MAKGKIGNRDFLQKSSLSEIALREFKVSQYH